LFLLKTTINKQRRPYRKNREAIKQASLRFAKKRKIEKVQLEFGITRELLP